MSDPRSSAELQAQKHSPPASSKNNSECPGSVIVNYLPQTFTEKELHELFSAAGTPISVKLMRDKKTGYSYGFGFVNYANKEQAERAIELLNGFQVESKKIKVSVAFPSSESLKGTNLYISNLPRDITAEQLETMFSKYGTIVHRTILIDKITKLPRGVGFVRFLKRDSANSALEGMTGYIPSGAEEAIKIKFAEDHGKQKAKYVAGFQAGASLHRRFWQ